MTPRTPPRATSLSTRDDAPAVERGTAVGKDVRQQGRDEQARAVLLGSGAPSWPRGCPRGRLRAGADGARLWGMSEQRSEVLAESKRKAIAAGVTTAAAVTLGVAGWPVTAVVAAVPAALLGYRWWKHRAVNGIRF